VRKINHYHPATGILKVASLSRYKGKCLREKRLLDAGLIDEIITFTKKGDFEHAIQVIQEYKNLSAAGMVCLRQNSCTFAAPSGSSG